MSESLNVELPESYRRVRKTYIFFAALLVFWEFLGVNINSVSNSAINIDIGAPQIIPSILFLIVFYFGYRLYVEWGYHNYRLWLNSMLGIKVNRLQSFDYYVSQIFGLFSVAIYFIQNTFNFQIIEIFPLGIAPTFALMAIIVYFIGVLFTSFFKLRMEKYQQIDLDKKQKLYMFSTGVMVILFLPFIYFLGLLASVKIYFIVLIIYHLAFFLFKIFNLYFDVFYKSQENS